MTGVKRARLSAVALGVALGVLCGVWMLTVGLLAFKNQTPFATELMTRWATIFPGVEVSIMGSCVAGAWGFLKGFFIGLVFGWIYNLCLCCCSGCHSGCCPGCQCASCCGTKTEHTIKG